MEDLTNLLNLIQYEGDIKGSIERIQELEDGYIFYISLNQPLSINEYIDFIDKLKNSFNQYKNIDVYFKNNSNILDYYNYFINKYAILDNLYNMFIENKVSYKNNILTLEFDSLDKEKTFNIIKDKMINDLKKAGFDIKDINYTIDSSKNEKEKLKKEEKKIEELMIKEARIEKLKEEDAKKENFMYRRNKRIDDECAVIGGLIEDEITFINSINEEIPEVALEVMLLEVEGKEIFSKEKNKEYKIINMKVTDFTDSMSCTLFANGKDEFERILKALKPNNFYRMRGGIRLDNRSHELSFSPRDIYKIDKKLETRKDNAQEKRVELHAHTKMSQMDGVAGEVDLVKQAIKFNHSGIAITDHDCCQAFPHVFSEVTDHNKSLKKAAQAKIDEIENKIKEFGETEELLNELSIANEEKKNLKFFKAAYGTELNMCESYLNVCFNPNDTLIKDNTFVIFDTETTGFNPGLGDSMIELGGVKIKNGEVIDRFDELINPKCHIDEEITRVTDISDDDVKDADTEEMVVKRFREWIGNLPLVAHNAKFDKNMLDMAYYKYNLGKLENPIIDTLMLSRVINRDLKKHSLKALGKYYGIDTGEKEEEETEETVKDALLDKTLDIKDILVDGISILKQVGDNIYVTKVHKASKTSETTIKVITSDSELENTYDLHPADNDIEVNITSFSKITVNIYVGQHHGADVDSENTAYIFNKMLKQIDGVEKISDLNNLGLLEEVAFKNNPKLLSKINELCSYKNYIKEEYSDNNPFSKYGVEGYSWKFPICADNKLGMYENIPTKTFTEHLANMYDSIKHITILAKNEIGLKNMFKLVSYANTNFIQSNATIPRILVNENREGLLIGSACLNGELFYIAQTRCDEDLKKAMEFYDYIEIQPIENYSHLLRGHDINNIDQLKYLINKIIKCAKDINKIVVATGDVHNIDKEDLIYREIIVNQNVPGKGRHPLARYLQGSPKYNENVNNINRLINDIGNILNNTDIKVLKYIYTLTNISKIPITPSNLVLIYHIDENESIKDTEIDKLEAIETSMRKLEVNGILRKYVENDDIRYAIRNDFRYYQETSLTESGHIPNQYFRTTDEMLAEFDFIDSNLAHEIVVTNTHKILDMIEEIEVVVYPDKPFSPIIPNSQETCRDLVFEKAFSMYGNPLPRRIEERIAQEFYGDKILNLVLEQMKIDNKDITDNEIDNNFSSYLHDVIMSGYDGVVNLMSEKIIREDNTKSKEMAIEEAKNSLGGIIGGGFDVIYLIAQKLVKHSNDDGYLVGSRGSVGSSFVASMMGITECNGLEPHYYCPKCNHSEFDFPDGRPFTDEYLSGYDLPNKNCPKCNTLMVHQGNDMPFATFLGFNADKVPDIDLNFSGDNQASAHEYTKVLFGTDNVYRAGTISTVADKTAYGYVLGYFEDNLYNTLKMECKSYGLDITGKDELKKKGIIKCDKRVAEVERLAKGCTDVKRTTGQHPGGIVVVPGYKDIWDFTPFQYPADDPLSAWRTTHFDYHAIDADLLKLDILGHDDPTVLRYLQDMTGVDVTNIDLGDIDTMKIFTGPEVLGVSRERLRGAVKKDSSGNIISKYCPTGTLGVPEFGTGFLLGMLEETKPTTFAELIKISGLSHGTDVWLGNARDLCTPDSEGNIKVPFKDVIGCRDDIMVNLIKWGMKPSLAFKIMEFVRKGKASKDKEKWAEFASEMKNANIPDWYIDSCQKIKYMFPKAHATAYVTSAFRIAWFKVHMPIYYYAAYFSIRCDQFDVATMIKGEDAIRNKIDELEEKKSMGKTSNKEDAICDVLYVCLEMTARGFYFSNIDLEKSQSNKFVVTEDKLGLIIPFSAMDGLGGIAASKIVEERNKKSYISIKDLKERGKVPEKIVNELISLGTLKDLPESNQLSIFNFI